jgi:rubrerythrin
MKSDRGGSRGARREQILSGMEKDSYKSPRKLPESSRCPQCGATFFKDRWTWKPALADSPAHICPACHRIKDKFPAGYVTLNGEYLTAHRDEIVSLA